MVNAADVDKKLEKFIEEQHGVNKSLSTAVEELTSTVNRFIAAMKGKDPILEDDSSINRPPHDEVVTPKARTTIDPRLTDVDRGAKLEVVDFHGGHNTEVYHDWLHSLEMFFRWYNLTDERKLFFAEAKLKGDARIWWTQYKRIHYGIINRWGDMKAAMDHHFVPPDYQQRAYVQFTNLLQGSKSVAEYTSLFYSLATKAQFPWVENVMISMYRRGLESRISSKVAASRFLTLSEAVQVAYQVEEELQKENSAKGKTSSNTTTLSRSEQTFVDAKAKQGKPFDRSQVTPNSNRQARSSTSSQGSSYTSRCFNCQGFGHHSFNCPSPPIKVTSGKSVALVEKGTSEDLHEDKAKEEVVCDPNESDFDYGIYNANDLDDDYVGVIRPLLVNKTKNDPLQQRGHIFQTRVSCNGQLCSLVIDTGSCADFISEEAVKKLGLQVQPHPMPYDVAWINNSKLRVTKQCIVIFSVGKLTESVMCDVLPLKPFHILLGRTWIWDRDVQHSGRANTYSFVKGDKKYTLTCATNMPPLKLKKSLVIHRVSNEKGILGPTPNSPESSSFQRRRVDAGQVLAKPRPKAFWSVNKCPW